jgi:hypothetical protein
MKTIVLHLKFVVVADLNLDMMMETIITVLLVIELNGSVMELNGSIIRISLTIGI